MYTLGLDTSHKFLVIALLDENGVVDGIQTDCRKQQSEYLLPETDRLLKKHGLKAEDIAQVVVTVGPGSYTGVRIAMTMAKVMGSLMNRKVYTLSTLQLYAGLKDCYSIIDARASRCYIGRYENGKPLMADTIYRNDEIRELLAKGETFTGDLHLFDREDDYGNYVENFWLLRDKWQPVENIDTLEPVYLKTNEEYL